MAAARSNLMPELALPPARRLRANRDRESHPWDSRSRIRNAAPIAATRNAALDCRNAHRGAGLASPGRMADTPLLTYLNDHVAGSRSALELLDYLIDHYADAETRAFFTTLRADVAADRQVLDDTIVRLGGTVSVLREAAGWFGDRVGRLKLMLDAPSGGGLPHLEALELLGLGILGKRSLWRAVEAVAPQVPALRDLDLRRLQARAEDQYSRVEARRLNTAAQALAA
jgi:hypothetical protein